jgi:DNA-binding beta-propeller fold protein YncE
MRALPALSLGVAALATTTVLGAAPLARAGYHVARTFRLGGDGGWDYLALDTTTNRLFIARQNRLLVVDPDKGTVVGEVPGLDRAHGIAFDDAHGRGFATSGRDGTVRMFDLHTLAPLGVIRAAADADAILYDPATQRIVAFNADGNSATVIDPAAGAVVDSIALHASPEFGVSAGNGMLYVNLEDADAVAEIDARAARITRQWSIVPCVSPTGLAIDREHGRLFSVCRNKTMAVSDIASGQVIATLPIGAGVDGARFDPATRLVLASNGEGTLTVIHEDTPDKFRVVETVRTMTGARTLELDPRTHRVYTVGAKFGPVPKNATTFGGHGPMVAGSFSLLVLAP